MLCSIATNIDESTLQTIQDLEKDLGKSLLAFKCHELKPSIVSDGELSRIKEVEKKLGMSLVAVEA
ncbi:MAG: hypothetical protein VR64_22105 [Desulfatitalea sp. BRH_c12]|nr:MAG: hypothetical protein VR64_22105 [Desulfatitalea sp. BRH_c12]